MVLTGYHRVGVFSLLTNSYAIVAVGGSENFYRCVYPGRWVELGLGLENCGLILELAVALAVFMA
jgi:hypothetical protein